MNLSDVIGTLEHEHAVAARAASSGKAERLMDAVQVLTAVEALVEVRWRSIDPSGHPRPLYDLTPDEITALGRLLEVCGAPT